MSKVTDSRLPPIVSVVMPAYNRADLLPKTITSILSQDFEDFELLVVDDGSTDKTAELIAEIQDQDPRLLYLPLSENKGIGFAREAGLRHVSGKYIALADSDDLWLPGKFKAQVEALEKYPDIEILFSDFWNINHMANTHAGGFSETQAGMEQLVVGPLGCDLWLIEGGVETGILRSNFIAAPTMLIRARVFDKVGGFVAAQVTGADFEFCWRAAVLGAQYAYINRPLIERHRYRSSVTAQSIVPILQKLNALERCYRTCTLAKRADLVVEIRNAQQRTWRKLLWRYGHNGQRAEAVRAFGRSLQCGFSTRNLIVLTAALLGPHAVSLALSGANRMSATTT